VLFEGPPGTGKTLCARIIASRGGVPLVHVPVESVVSKWYGEAEKKLAKVFECCEQMGGAIVFIDEVDALATSRDSGSSMHEVTRRLLSVLLTKVEGFASSSKTTLVCATNRRSDLDPALLSRFDLCLNFPLPSTEARAIIFQRYAKQLSDSERWSLAELSEGFSCRDIKEACGHAERRWVSKMLRKESQQKSGVNTSLEHVPPPPVNEYKGCIGSKAKLHT